MKKDEVVSLVCEALKQTNTRKFVSIPKQEFTITDDEGQSKKFAIKRADKEVLYTNTDVRNIVDMLIEVLLEAMRNGESVYLPKFGTICPHYREARRARIPNSRQWCDIPPKYVPKLKFSKAMVDAAREWESRVLENGDPLLVPVEKRKKGRRPVEDDMSDDIEDFVDDDMIDEEGDDGI